MSSGTVPMYPHEYLIAGAKKLLSAIASPTPPLPGLSVFTPQNGSKIIPVTLYCVKCRTRRIATNPQTVYMTNGKPATRGLCSTCGTGMYKIGALSGVSDASAENKEGEPEKSVSLYDYLSALPIK